MRCPNCKETGSKVVDSRPGADGTSIRRRRECEACGSRFTTYERLEIALPMIVKRDLRREPYDPEKVRRALRIACRKRPVSADAVERIVDEVGRAIAGSGEREVPSEAIGRALLKQLGAVDQVSYGRFASVFLRFETLEDFTNLSLDALPEVL